MFDPQEQLLEKHEHKIQEFTKRFDHLDGKFSQLFNEYQITQEEITQFLQNRQNFDDKTWDALEAMRKELDEKLKKEIDNIKNPLKTKGKLADLHVARHWLFVK